MRQIKHQSYSLYFKWAKWEFGGVKVVKYKKEHRSNPWEQHAEFKLNNNALTSSWSYIWGSCPECGLHHAAQMSHSPHQPRQPGPVTQHTHTHETSHITTLNRNITQLPPWRLMSVGITHMERELLCTASTSNTYYLTEAHWQAPGEHIEQHAEKVADPSCLFKHCPPVEKLWVSCGLRGKQTWRS